MGRRGSTPSYALNIPRLSLIGIPGGVDGVVRLSAAALRDVNCKRTAVNLDHNDVGDTGAKQLRDAIQDAHCKLTELNLKYNHKTAERYYSRCTL